MTEQPPEQQRTQITVTNKQAAMALALYKFCQPVVDNMLERAPEGYDRIAAESWARRIVMSACLCKQSGIGPAIDEILFTTAAWQDLLAKMIFTYEKTEVEGQ